MTSTIDYSKYENMTKRQIVVSLEKAEKRVATLHEKYLAKLAQENQLIDFLKSKMGKMLDTKYNFIPYKESEVYKIAREREKMRTPEEQAQLEREVQELINMDYGDEL